MTPQAGSHRFGEAVAALDYPGS